MGTDYSVMWHHIPEAPSLVLHHHENLKMHIRKGSDMSFFAGLAVKQWCESGRTDGKSYYPWWL